MRVHRPLAVCLLLFAPAAFAQSAGITGRVIDRTGAVVPGTSITVISAATGAERKVVTNEDGYYTVPLLPPANIALPSSTSASSP